MENLTANGALGQGVLPESEEDIMDLDCCSCVFSPSNVCLVSLFLKFNSEKEIAKSRLI